MSIHYEHGDIFSSQAEAILNTLNCVGVMGKGIALEFKKRWKNNFKAYKKLCDAKMLRPGKMFIYDTSDLLTEGQSAQRYLINFPTKDHWRGKSKFSYIAEGLDDFIVQIQERGIRSVAMPPLGCGNGGLDWAEVRELIEQKLSSVDGVSFHVYGPKENNQSAPEHESRPAAEMTYERALLIRAIGEFEPYFGGFLTRLCLQKIVYFLQATGVSYRVQFSRNTHGPYSERLHKAFQKMDAKGFLVNYVSNESEIQVSAGTLAEANSYLNRHEQSDDEVVDKISRLIEGYESPYGMELLSSVDYLSRYEELDNMQSIAIAIKEWNEGKKERFNDQSIEHAYQRLMEDGFIN